MFPLTGNKAVTLKAIALKRKAPITEYIIGQTLHLNLRIYDGTKSNWFATLDLPDKAKAWVTAVTLLRWHSAAHTKVVCTVPALRSTIVLHRYDFNVYTTAVAIFSADAKILVNYETEGTFTVLSTV